jgi:1-deoxy-D-xylulose-5-phosphate reductoisomerase
VPPLDLGRLGALTFEAPDFVRFRALALAYDVLAAGGTAPAIFNAANEVAVAAFLRGALPFVRITDVIEAGLARVPVAAAASVEDILEADRRAREAASASAERRLARSA